MNIYENEDVVPNVASLGRQGLNQGSPICLMQMSQKMVPKVNGFKFPKETWFLRANVPKFYVGTLTNYGTNMHCYVVFRQCLNNLKKLTWQFKIG